MKPAPFAYHRPSDRREALELLAAARDDFDAEVKVLAGGQSLVPAMNFRLARPTALVDLQQIDDLVGVDATTPQTLRIGAMTTQRSVERHADVATHAPLLAEALPFVAHPQIRNRGTVGGSVAHADPASELPALLLALDARLELQNVDDHRAGKTRTVQAEDFFVGLFETALEPDDLLVSIGIEAIVAGEGQAFDEVSRRSGDYALCGCAARLRLAPDGRCTLARLAFLSVADQALRATEAEAGLVGELLTEDADQRIRDVALHAAEHEIAPGDDIHASARFRRHLAAGLGQRTLLTALQRARATLAQRD